MIVCLCRGISDRAIVAAIAAGHTSLPALAKRLGVGTGCGACHATVRELVRQHAPKPQRFALASAAQSGYSRGHEETSAG